MFKYAGPGCDVCGYGTVEDCDRYDPRKSCPECHHLALTLKDRIEMLGSTLQVPPLAGGYLLIRTANCWRILGAKGISEDLPASVSSMRIEDAVAQAEDRLRIHYGHVS